MPSAGDTRELDDPMSHRGTAVRAVLVLVLALGLLAGGAAAAHAHGDEGEMEVLAAEPAGPLEIAIEVGIVYANDDDLATEATVTVTAVGADGTTLGPIDVPVTTDARYGTTFEVPAAGSWTLTVTSTDPAAEQTAEVTASGATTTTTDPPATTEPTSSPSDMTESTAPTTADATATTDGPADNTTDDTDDDDGSGLGLLVVLAVLVAGMAAFGMIILRNRSSDPSSEPEDDGSRS